MSSQPQPEAKKNKAFIYQQFLFFLRCLSLHFFFYFLAFLLIGCSVIKTFAVVAQQPQIRTNTDPWWANLCSETREGGALWAELWLSRPNQLVPLICLKKQRLNVETRRLIFVTMKLQRNTKSYFLPF